MNFLNEHKLAIVIILVTAAVAYYLGTEMTKRKMTPDHEETENRFDLDQN